MKHGKMGTRGGRLLKNKQLFEADCQLKKDT